LIQAILFDLDGLAVDSEPHSIVSWAAVLARRGVTLDQPTLDRVLGWRIDDTSRLFVEQYQLSDRPVDLSREKTEYQINHLAGNVPPMPGLIELLDAIDEWGLKKAIASSGRRPYVIAVLRAADLDQRFGTLVTGDDVANGKPAPDIFLAAAQALGVEPASCLVLEDAPAGVQAAKAAGMLCIAIPNDFTRSLDLSLADRRLPSLHNVRELLPQLVEGVKRET
jgi:HAD superfamily hydrolase (TIGR01509 family)